MFLAKLKFAISSFLAIMGFTIMSGADNNDSMLISLVMILVGLFFAKRYSFVIKN